MQEWALLLIIRMVLFFIAFIYYIAGMHYLDKWKRHACSDMFFYIGLPAIAAALLSAAGYMPYKIFGEALLVVSLFGLLLYIYRRVYLCVCMCAALCVPILCMHCVVTGLFLLFSDGRMGSTGEALSVLLAVITGGAVFLLGFKNMYESPIDIILEKKGFSRLACMQLLILCYAVAASFFCPEGAAPLSYVQTAIMQALVIPLFYYISAFGMRSLYAHEQEQTNRALNELIKRQALHYSAYQNHVEHLSRFKQEYKVILRGIHQHLENGRIEKAQTSLNRMGDLVQKTILAHKELANSPLIDAFLQETAELCKKLNISFKAGVFLPAQVRKYEVELCEILFTVTEFMFKIIQKSPDKGRFLRFKSSSNKNWAIMHLTASLGAEPSYEDNVLTIYYKGRLIETFALLDIRRKLENMNGGMEFEINKEDEVFSIHFHFNMNEEISSAYGKRNLIDFSKDG